MTLCEDDSTLRIYKISDLSFIAEVNLADYASDEWILLGNAGFDVVQHGNRYLIFFSSVESLTYSYLMHAVELLFDPVQSKLNNEKVSIKQEISDVIDENRSFKREEDDILDEQASYFLTMHPNLE